MYGLPADINLSFLVGKEICQDTELAAKVIRLLVMRAGSQQLDRLSIAARRDV
jgi:hypothetical protein